MTTKFMLLRDGQIVGYERNKDGLIERSYDNQIWTPLLEIPYNETRELLNWDANLLQEVFKEEKVKKKDKDK